MENKMLDLKIGQFYSDNEGNKWLFCRYDATNKGYISYVFYSSKYNIKHFNQYCNDDVLYCNISNSRVYINVNDPDAWIISKEYDAIDLNKKVKFKVKFIEKFNSNDVKYVVFKTNDNQKFYMEDYGETAVSKTLDSYLLVFKNGVESILKWEYKQ